MKLKEDASEEKLHGRYFTPEPIADYVTDWVMDQEGAIGNILEPSVGDGVFIKSIHRHIDVWENANMISIEINEDVSKAAAGRYEQLEWKKGWERKIGESGKVIINDDFYKAYKSGLCQNRYHAILGNPPYIRYQYLNEEQRKEQSEILTQNGMIDRKSVV